MGTDNIIGEEEFCVPSRSSLSRVHEILISIRPRLSVWSHPHKWGTLSVQRLCTFISHAAHTKSHQSINQKTKRQNKILILVFTFFVNKKNDALNSKQMNQIQFENLIWIPLKFIALFSFCVNTTSIDVQERFSSLVTQTPTDRLVLSSPFYTVSIIIIIMSDGGGWVCVWTADVFLTFTFHSLMEDTVEKRATMVAECRAAVRVRLEFMCRPGILEKRETKKIEINYTTDEKRWIIVLEKEYNTRLMYSQFRV